LILGHTPPRLAEEASFFAIGLRSWWQNHIQEVRKAGHRFSYHDMHSGNFSIGAELYRRVGGFHPGFGGRSGEDYDLGVRLLNMGVSFSFAPEAVGYHHDTTTLDRSFLRARHEGAGDVVLGTRHPELRRSLTLAHFRSPAKTGPRLIRHLAFHNPLMGDRVMGLLRPLLGPFEWARFRRKYQTLYGLIRAYWYCRGAAEELGSDRPVETLARWLDTAPDSSLQPLTDLDLSMGLAAATRQLDRERPAGIRVLLDGREVGKVPPIPGAEPLNATHLPTILTDAMHEWFLPAFALHASQNPTTWRHFFDSDRRSAEHAEERVSPRSDGAASLGEIHLGAGRSGDAFSGTGFTDNRVTPRSHRDTRSYAVSELELSESPVPISAEGQDRMLVLARWRGRPLGWVQLKCPTGLAEQRAFGRAAIEQIGWDLAAAVLSDQDQENTAAAPAISVVICTRNRPDLLARCLSGVNTQSYSEHEVIVVDNAPTDDATRDVAERFGVRYLREDRPGLDWARNRGIAEARHDIIAFTDDDVRPDREWLAGIARGFANPVIMAVTGLVAPMELDTPAQVMFERIYGGMGKGMHGRLFHRDLMRPSEMIAIYTAGVGANMAFRREVFEQLGGFDTALDVGTPACGGGDLDMFHRTVAAGLPLWYEPRALVWHQHRRDISGLRRQLYNDGRSFAVYLIKLWRTHTVPRRSVARFALWRWGPWLVGRTVIGALGRHPLPLPLLWAGLWGALHGPTAYVATYRQDRRLRSGSPLQAESRPDDQDTPNSANLGELASSE
jgi:GT2 family glycosyltransferase